MQDAAGRPLLAGAHYYWFFTGCMVAATLLLVPLLWTFSPREYLQPEASGHDR
jgi:hypothetical protein